VSGTTDARIENAKRPAIEPAQSTSHSSQARQQLQQGTTSHAKNTATTSASKDTVSISAKGKEAAASQDISELSSEEEDEVQTLKERDQEVRIHEQAHAAVGGQYAGSPTYEYETGPDGKRYAVAGEVSIDVSEEEEPEDTVQKMQIVRAAALAPAEPSTQDIKVAAEAAQKEQKAQSEISEQSLDFDNTDNDHKATKDQQINKDVNASSKKLQAFENVSANMATSSFLVRA